MAGNAIKSIRFSDDDSEDKENIFRNYPQDGSESGAAEKWIHPPSLTVSPPIVSPPTGEPTGELIGEPTGELTGEPIGEPIGETSKPTHRFCETFKDGDSEDRENISMDFSVDDSELGAVEKPFQPPSVITVPPSTGESTGETCKTTYRFCETFKDGDSEDIEDISTDFSEDGSETGAVEKPIQPRSVTVLPPTGKPTTRKPTTGGLTGETSKSADRFCETFKDGDSEDIENISTDFSEDDSEAGAVEKSIQPCNVAIVPPTCKLTGEPTGKPTGELTGEPAGEPTTGETSKPAYRFCETFKEDHGNNLFAIQFNQHNHDQQVFATAGANRMSIYECMIPTGIRLLRMYIDPAEDECFYSLSWSYDKDIPVIAVAGKRAVIRIIYPTIEGYNSDKVSYRGHGQTINHLTFNHTKPHLLLSASSDCDLRLWNIKTHVCLAILGGVKGHTDKVLYAEFCFDGSKIVSCGRDRFLKLWNLDKVNTKAAIDLSLQYDKASLTSFPVCRDHVPVFSTRNIHNNYIDCVLDFGKFIISKSCENEVVIWRPGGTGMQANSGNKSCVTIVARLPVKNTEIWFLRVSLDRMKKNMALGNLVGKVYLWDLDVDDHLKIRSSILAHPACTTAIRQTSFSTNSETLVACCDDGSVWRWTSS